MQRAVVYLANPHQWVLLSLPFSYKLCFSEEINVLVSVNLECLFQFLCKYSRIVSSHALPALEVYFQIISMSEIFIHLSIIVQNPQPPFLRQAPFAWILALDLWFSVLLIC